MVRYVSTYDQFKENPVTSSIGLDLPVDCPICQESSVDCYRLGQHVYKSHKNLPIDIRKVFICGGCSTTYTCPRLLIKHVERFGSKCDKKFKVSKVKREEIEKADEGVKGKKKK
ncbi:hypothetical protein PENTCL1PPCAC_22999 [Pristionchus entomophagus]|uniref:C2H2-type domain-containing protein n=1 Tax=Pristionchus entomophagus TaxID=358040 RepID=A0AAV5U3L7_9BILA|nr:hypothetical protein PENTCL1PPCAC_22999 [Pristionchus entomophagus]